MCKGSWFFFQRTELCQLAQLLQILSIALPSRNQFKMQHRYFCKIWTQSPPALAFYFHNLNLFPDSLISKGQQSTSLSFRNQMKSRCPCWILHCTALYRKWETSCNKITLCGNSWLWPSSQSLRRALPWVWLRLFEIRGRGNKVKSWK